MTRARMTPRRPPTPTPKTQWLRRFEAGVSKWPLSTYIGEQALQLGEGHGVALGQVTQGGAQLSVWTTILGDDN